MKITRRQFAIALGAAGAAFAAPTKSQGFVPNQALDLGGQGVLYKARFQPFSGFGSIACAAAVLLRRSFRATIVENRDRRRGSTAVHDIATRYNARVAINGGRFNGAFAPDGLLIVAGNVVGRKRADWSGVFEIDRDGLASVTTTPDLRTAQYAVQGYPTLLQPGAVMGVEREDHIVERRTVVAQSGDLILAMVTSPVSLYQLAYMLIEYPDVFYLHQIDAALNLSGAATSAMYARLADGSEFEEAAYWPNRDVIVFTDR